MGKKLKRLAKIAKWAVSPLVLYASTIPIAWTTNKFTRPQSNTAVFSCSSPNSKVATLTDFFMYPVVTLRQNLDGNRVDWHRSPTGNEFLEKIVNEKYSNIILIGYGSSQCYQAPNEFIGYWEIDRKMSEQNIPKKDGFLIQLTCGGSEGITMRQVLLKDPNKGYSFEGKIGSLDIYFTAVRDLFCPRRYHSARFTE